MMFRGSRKFRVSLRRVDDQLSGVRLRAMLPYVNALPRPEHQVAGIDRNRQRRGSQHCLDVRRHIVRTLSRVRIKRIILRDKPVQPLLKIALRGGVRIFLNRQRRRRVLNKDRTKPLNRTRLRHDSLNVIRNIVQSRILRGNRKAMDHEWGSMDVGESGKGGFVKASSVGFASFK